ncbi:hypothetical protein DFH06DRAFT_1321854 [Mycena polygramma]|nr:hypothetical protein DFH06DRAFT_1321854 [Mycena polygramma]
MSSYQYHSHRSPSKVFPGVYCPQCDPCPTCGAGPRSALSAEIASPRINHERILPTMPIALPFTLFILEAYIQGGWLHLVIPYTICLLVFYL